MPFKPKNSRFYHYDFQIRGRRFHGSCETEDFEEAKAVEAQARVSAKSDKKTLGRFTLGEALGTYWSDVCQHQASASTAQSQARAILEVLDGKTPIESLTNADLVKAVAKMRGRVKNSTANRRIEMLARSLRYMGKVHGAKVPELDFKAVRTKEAEERVRELTRDEQARLFRELRPDLLPMVKFALLTGQRKAEICGLKWKDINHETGRITFRVKGGKTHRIPINAEIRALLSALPRSNIVAARSYVFTYLGKDCERRPISASGGHIYERWREALAAAEIEDFRFHDLRHTFATRLLRRTGNIKLVSRILGHSNVETTSRYAHVLDEDMADAMENFSTLNPEVSPEVSANPLKGKAW